MDSILILLGVIALAFFLAWVYGVFPPNITRGSGKIISQKVDVNNFDRVLLLGSGNVYITQEAAESLTIEADENILPWLETTVKGSELILSIKPNQRVIPSQPIVYRATMKDVRGIKLNGSGNFYVDLTTSDAMHILLLGSGNIELKDLTANQLSMDLFGSGNITLDHLVVRDIATSVQGSGDLKFLEGKAGSQTISISGSGKYTAEAVETDSAEISIPGSANVSVWVKNDLSVKISGSGSVRYYGRPSVDQSVLGSGRIVSLGEK